MKAAGRRERSLQTDTTQPFTRAPPAALHIRRRVFGPMAARRVPGVDAASRAVREKC